MPGIITNSFSSHKRRSSCNNSTILSLSSLSISSTSSSTTPSSSSTSSSSRSTSSSSSNSPSRSLAVVAGGRSKNRRSSMGSVASRQAYTSLATLSSHDDNCTDTTTTNVPNKRIRRSSMPTNLTTKEEESWGHFVDIQKW